MSYDFSRIKTESVEKIDNEKNETKEDRTIYFVKNIFQGIILRISINNEGNIEFILLVNNRLDMY